MKLPMTSTAPSTPTGQRRDSTRADLIERYGDPAAVLSEVVDLVQPKLDGTLL